MKAARKTTVTIQPWDCDGLEIYVRGKTFHVIGTLRVGKRSQRVRETLGVPATKDKRQEAEREARRIAAGVRGRLGGGAVRKSVATLVSERFQSRIGPTDRRVLTELTAEFTARILYDIPPTEIVAFVDKRHLMNKAETRERYISSLCAFLNRQIAAGQYPAMPEFVRDQEARNPAERSTRDVSQFRLALLEDVIDAAHPTIAIQLQVEYCGGTRVSSVLHGAALKDLDMQKMVLTFRKTKNKKDVPVALPETMREPMTQYLKWRKEQVRAGRVGPGSNERLFLSYRGRPYKENGSKWGTQNKTGFNAAKRRAIKTVGERYDNAIAEMKAANDRNEVDRLMRLKEDDLNILRRLTQHWLRHKFATEAGRSDLRAAMLQGGWRDVRSIMGYLIADAEYQRSIVENRGSPRSKELQQSA
ncbi:tyrosine-type recombinase/integrase [Afipia sp. GAS231]|uniref:tyrosine-type recombinase/integrase n=1 Tax=Afipia sp. GAS231 TaxID=1882747 RepID=UPI00087DEB49|nr:tyrosine-type recombinase/integrase [Afipia sp. GAS231]SDO47971.1 Phage integrase family protein [Afipia sp. GAS231]